MHGNRAVRPNASRFCTLMALAVLTLAAPALAPRTLAAGPSLLIPKAPGAITVDGRLADWSQLSTATAVSLTSADGGAANPGRVRFSWDESNIYVAAEVTDQEITVADDLSRDFAGSDALRVYLRFGPENGDPAPRLGDGDYVFIVTPTSLFQKPLKTVYGYGGYEHLDLDLTRLKVAARPTDAGYSLELSIPWRELKTEPKRGLDFSLQVVTVNASKQGSRSFAMLTPVPVTSLDTPEAIAQSAVLD